MFVASDCLLELNLRAEAVQIPVNDGDG